MGASVVGANFRLAFVSVVVGEGSVFTVVSGGVVGFRLGCGSVALGGVGGSVGFFFVVTSFSLFVPEGFVGAVVRILGCDWTLCLFL